MDGLADLLKTRRKALGISQVALAGSSGVSLPTIQNLEAGKGNPGVQVLEPLLAALGAGLELRPLQPDWAMLAAFGAPLSPRKGDAARPTGSLDPSMLLDHLKLALLEQRIAMGTAKDQDRTRKREVIQAMLLAMQLHYPGFYGDCCRKVPALAELTPRVLTGRLIKLKRQALAGLSEHL